MSFAATTHAERALQPQPGCRPGERLNGGRPIIFSLDALRDHECELAIRNAPADLSDLSDEALRHLLAAYIDQSARRPNDALVAAVGRRAHVERTYRPALQSAYGPVAERPGHRVAA